ncbi:MAG TPA: hypothetical protein VFI95_06025 [Terriglobales bacterium]|nr:hypothetical protein [Terriglobales bacterium]
MAADRQTRRSLFQALADRLRRLFGGKPEPSDPYADRFAPVRRGPKNRSGAAAVAEPEEEDGFFPPRK